MGIAPCAIPYLCHRSLTASGPAKFMGLVDVRAMEDASAHRSWGACV